MIEIRIHGRGGQGGVTLAKLIATTRYLLGESVQAFGVYAAERSGAPLQAFCRCDTQPITNRNMVYEPDHLIVLDPTLVAPAIASGLEPGGWILMNTPADPVSFGKMFAGYGIATVDASAIARANGLGTASVPIVNTALLGAVARVLDFPLAEANAALEHLGFTGGNVTAAQEAFDQVRLAQAEGIADVHPSVVAHRRTPGVVEGRARQLPKIRTGDWASRQPHRRTMVPPCNHICPAGNDVQGFLAALAREDYDGALETLLETTPFPSVCGRVCPAPCMDRCNRIQIDGAVNVRELERLAGDRGRAKVHARGRRRESVAVVGSGPAGMSAAYQLARLGYGVTVFDGAPAAGGLLHSGIPPYRLPRDVLAREIDRILALGVKLKLETRVDRRVLCEIAERFDSILVATGLQQLRDLQLGQADAGVVMQGIDFLDRANADADVDVEAEAGAGAVRLDGERIVVVGGGNTAFDAARSALRLGAASVRIVYRRTRDEMPAIREEIDEALEEGVTIDELSLPLRLAPAARGHHLTCRRMELGAPDASGRRRPVEVDGLDYDIACDRVILALGQSAETSIFPEGTEVREGADLIGVLQTPVFAVGDLATNEGTVAAAIGSGRRAAFHMHHTLTGEQLLPDPHADDAVVGPDDMHLHLFERQARHDGATLPGRERRFTLDEVHAGLPDASEAGRCLSCGVCNECDRCVTYCPEGVLKRVGHEFRFDYSACKGCGVCVAECPRSVVYMSTI